jgi:hypothetical protein
MKKAFFPFVVVVTEKRESMHRHCRWSLPTWRRSGKKTRKEANKKKTAASHSPIHSTPRCATAPPSLDGVLANLLPFPGVLAKLLPFSAGPSPEFPCHWSGTDTYAPALKRRCTSQCSLLGEGPPPTSKVPLAAAPERIEAYPKSPCPRSPRPA